MALRTRLILLWAGFLIVSGALFAELLRERAEAEADASRLVQGYARLLAEHTTGAIRNSELAAHGLAAHPEVQRALAAARGEATGTRPPDWPDLETLMRAIPGAINVYVADHDGRVLTSAMALPRDTRIAGREYFRQLADADGPIATVSGTIRGRASGKWAIQVARRIEDRDGHFLGIVGVSLGIDESFSRFYRSVDFPAQATISLWDDQRQLLMRYPADPAEGQPSATASVLEALWASEQREALHTSRSDIDGQTQIMAVRKLQADPILSVVTLPEEAYLKAWRASAYTASTITLALLAACGVLTLRIRQQQQAVAAQASESRRRAEQLEAYGRIVETAPVALALVDAELRCVIMNTAFAGLLGREARAFAGQPVAELLADKAWDAVHQDIRAALDGSSRRRTLQMALGATQHRFDVEVTPFLRNWRPAGAVLSLRDVTVQRLAEEALMRREAELKAIFESGPECMKVIGRDGRIQRINPAGLAILEADDLEHGLATRLETLVDPADRAAFIDFNARVMKGESGTLQYRGVGLKGTPRWVETHAVPMRDNQGAITGALAITRDISATHQTAALLQSTLAEQRAIVDSGLIGIARVRDRHILWSNAACERLLGYTAADLAGKPTEVLYTDPATHARVGEAYASLNAGGLWHGGVPLRHRDGSTRWFALSGGQLPDGDTLWVLVDVTEQHAAEVQLRQLSLAVEQSPASIVITNARMEIEYVNRAFTLITGYGPEDALGRNPRFLQSGKTPRETYLSLRQHIDAGEVWQGEFHNRRKNGEEYIEQQLISPVREPDGAICHYLAIKEDVTEKKQLAVELDLHRNQLEALVKARTAELDELYNQAPCGYHSFDAEGRIVAINDTELGMLGYTREEIVGRKRIADLIAPYERPVLAARFAALMHDGMARDLDYDFIRKDGTALPVLVSAEVLRDDAGNFLHGHATLTDNRERKAKERQIATLNAELERRASTAERESVAKSSFLANMSHEIRTPMNAIIGMAHLLRRTELTARQAVQLGRIETAGQHLLKVINDVLDISKIEAGRLALEQIEIAPNELLPGISALIEDRAIEKGLRIVLDSQPISARLWGDPTRLRQALLNLANNAIKFTEQGAVVLRMQPLEEDDASFLLRFEVQDTGVGIEAEVLAELFSAFQQGDNSTTRKYGGTGLGLVITRQLAQLMGGDAGAESRAGAGSMFWFTARLQKVAPESRPPGHRVGAPAPMRPTEAALRGAILLVEDEPINREIAFELLTESGFEVSVARNGAEAIEQVARQPPSLILMDMQMPVMDGCEATRRLRNQPGLSHMPIVAMTANAFAEDRAECFGAGMDDFLTKPIDPDLLISTVEHWLRSGR